MIIDFDTCPICHQKLLELSLLDLKKNCLACPNKPRHFYQNLTLNRLEIDFDEYYINYYNSENIVILYNDQMYDISNLNIDIKNFDKDSFINQFETFRFYS